MKPDKEKAEEAVRSFLEAYGIDVEARGMERTPERVASLFADFFDGVDRGTEDLWGETYASGSGEAAGVIAVRHIPFYSLCEHHLVPFFGTVDIAYQPHDGRVAGFSKFTDLVRRLSHRPQLQERFTSEIASAIQVDLGAGGVLVLVTADQLCMMMLGQLAPGTRTVTSEILGTFRQDPVLYAQAWQLLTGTKK